MAAPLLAALLRCSEGAAAAAVLQRALPPLGARLADAAAPHAARDDAQRALLALLQTVVCIGADASGGAAGAALRPHSAALLLAAREVATRGLGGGGSSGGRGSGGGDGGPMPNAVVTGATPNIVSPPTEMQLEALQAEPTLHYGTDYRTRLQYCNMVQSRYSCMLVSAPEHCVLSLHMATSFIDNTRQRTAQIK